MKFYIDKGSKAKIFSPVETTFSAYCERVLSGCESCLCSKVAIEKFTVVH
jgi:hypothetical protein